MPKKQYSGFAKQTKKEKSPRTSRSGRTKISKSNVDMKELKIPPSARQERDNTINALIPRELNQVAGRDKEFKKFLSDQYRMYCPTVKCRYKRLPKDVMDECVRWILAFKGVNKKTDDCLVVDRRFDLPEGRSWVDQRRSKKIIPLFISWLDTIVDAAEEMRAQIPTLPRDLDLIMVEKLLTTSYHPQSSQSNQTLLVCQQSLHTAKMRMRLKDFEIVVPDSKKDLSKFIHNLRQKVENRRLGLSPDSNGGFDVTTDSSDSETDQGSVVDQSALIAQKDMELDELRRKYTQTKSRCDWLENQCSQLQQKVDAYQQQAQNQMMLTFPSWSPVLMGMRVPPPPPPPFFPSPPTFSSDQFSASSSPLLSASPSDASFVPELPPEIDGYDCYGEDVAMTDGASDIPLTLPEVDRFFNYENLGF